MRRAPFTRSKQRTQVILPYPTPELSSHNSSCPCVKRGQETSEQQHGKRKTRMLLGSDFDVGKSVNISQASQTKEVRKAAAPQA